MPSQIAVSEPRTIKTSAFACAFNEPEDKEMIKRTRKLRDLDIILMGITN
jgi:hypothetical protein